MNKIIEYLKILAIPLGVSLLLSLIFGLFNLLGLNTSNIVLLVIMIVTMLISGVLIGKKTQKKGYLNGLLFGLITSFLFFILSLLFKNSYGINNLIYYTIIIVSSMFGSMIGVQLLKK